MAWLQGEDEIPIPGDGNNLIPTLHIKDLVTFIKRIIEFMPVQSYFIAVDKTLNKTLKSIVNSIATSLGNGKTSLCDASALESFPKYSEIMFNVKLKTSKFFDDIISNDKPKIPFKWEAEVNYNLMIKFNNFSLEYKQILTR